MVKMNQPEDSLPDANPATRGRRIMNALSKLRNFSIGRRSRKFLEAYTKSKGGGEIKLPPFEASLGEEPIIPFETQMLIYASDPIVGPCLDFINAQFMGAGFHTTMNDDYEKLIKNDVGIEKSPTGIIDDYCELVDMDGLFFTTGLEAIGYGNSFWHVPGGDFTKLKQVPLNAIDRIFRGEKRDWEISEQVPKVGYRLKYTWEGGRMLKPEDVIHFRFNPIGDSAFGFGLVTRVCLDLPLGGGKKREAFYKVHGKAQRSEILWMEKFGKGNELWILPNASSNLGQYQKIIKNMPDSGARWVTDMEKADVKQIVPERARGADAYIENITNSYMLAMETPLPKLFTTPGFTEASANAALDIADLKITAFKRFMKRIAEKRVFWPVLTDVGFDPVEAKVRINWGMPDSLDFEALQGIMPVITQIWSGGGIFTWEMREILRTICHLPIQRMKKPKFTVEMAKDVKLREAILRAAGKGTFIIDNRRRHS